ncbi:MAG: hypothetical protein HYS51_00050 [Candidatus Zambryskibacteria bacterium]|nr:hypothetical protein [Candidatus Zambryskibacteria bacterium]
MRSPVQISPFAMDEGYEIRDHLVAQFGGYKECCKIFAPKVGTTFVVTEPIQGCHHQNPLLVPGTYSVKEWIPDNSSHHIRVQREGEEQDQVICIGYAGESQLDWRGAQAQRC